MERIVIAVDDSPAARQALRWGSRLARATPAVPIHAVTVFPPRRASGLGLPPAVPGDVHREQRDQHIQRFRDAVIEEVPLGTTVRTRVLDGDAVEQILAYLRPRDLLVMGRTSRGALTSLLRGSASTRCVTRAPCAVLLVPESRPGGGLPSRRHARRGVTGAGRSPARTARTAGPRLRYHSSDP